MEYRAAMAKHDLFSSDWLDDMAEGFDGLFKGFKLDGVKVGETTTTTQVSTFDREYKASVNDKEMVISIELPGVLPHMVTAEVNGQTLTVRYPRDGRNLVQKYTIRPEFDFDNVRATLALGVLELRLPRREVPKGKRVNVVLG